MAVRVLEETGLLPHLNPGVMSWAELQAAQAGRAVDGHDARDHLAAAVRDRAGRTTARPTRTPPSGCGSWRTPAGCRSRSPPACSSASARRCAERAESLFALRAYARAPTAHIQEVIVQNFRAKPDTAMRHADDLGLDEYRAAIAVARLVLGPKARVQAPPNLVDLDGVPGPARRRHRRLGRRLPADARPRQPRAALARNRRARATRPPTCGFELRERLTVHPEYVARAASRGSTRGSPATSPRWPAADGLARPA